MAQTVNINGKSYEIDVDGSMPLLWFLRDKLELTGTKFGCGMAVCGACTVHLDGQATRSCVIPGRCPCHLLTCGSRRQDEGGHGP